jgi:DNA polymerase elongation subunit (family B)
MQLVNIGNKRREIFLFLRNDVGELKIEKVIDFYPYYYEADVNGKFTTFNGLKVKKIICNEPTDIANQRNEKSWEADVIFSKRFMIDRIDALDKCIIKYAFIDIEVFSPKGFPDQSEAKYPVSCITIYNSASKKLKTFYLGDYEGKLQQREIALLKDFCQYMKAAQFDIWFSWNVDFDYTYLFNRIDRFKREVLETLSRKVNFASYISPIGSVRQGEREDVWFPSGLSIVDYMQWYQKFTNKTEPTYALDAIAQKHLGEATWGEAEFDKITIEIRKKNQNDVVRMVKLEKKFQLIQYYDEIRRRARVTWEDLYHNSRIVDQLLLRKAFEKKIILPCRQKDLTKEVYDGAYREAHQTGVFKNIGKFDLSSAYPTILVDFCLDPANIVTERGDNVIEAAGTLFKQDDNALLPAVVRDLIVLKNDLKKAQAVSDSESAEGKLLDKKYTAIKSIINSIYGVMGNRFFRYYDRRVASATTWGAREALKYVENRLLSEGRQVIYVDTDSVFIDEKNNISDQLNSMLQDWYLSNNNNKRTLTFDYEGYFTKLIVLAKCRYKGYVQKPNGKIKSEVKGIEAKRRDTSKFCASFQTTLLDKVMDGMNREETVQWLKEQVATIKNLPISEFAFPCKMRSSVEEYKVLPIFIRALNYSRELYAFSKQPGDLFYYIYMQSFGNEVKTVKQWQLNGKNVTPKRWKDTLHLLHLDETAELNVENDITKQLITSNILKEEEITKPGAVKNVLAFDSKKQTHIDREKIDWQKMIERNIDNKAEVVFTAMKWEKPKLLDKPL